MNSQDLIPRIVKSKLFIDKNIEAELTLNLISRQANFSVYHYIRLFKTIYGITPYQYLKEKRIEIAKRKLAKSNLSITKICFDSGFESVGSFSNLFKSVVGLSPKKFREQEKKKQTEIAKQPLKYIPYFLNQKIQPD